MDPKQATQPSTHFEEREAFDGGAIRCSLSDVRYDLISPRGLRRLAETYAEGARKYSPHNWEKGMPCSVVMNHCMEHLNRYMQGDTSEDHLAHAAWNLFALMHFEHPHYKKFRDIPARDNEYKTQAVPEQKKHAKVMCSYCHRSLNLGAAEHTHCEAERPNDSSYDPPR